MEWNRCNKLVLKELLTRLKNSIKLPSCCTKRLISFPGSPIISLNLPTSDKSSFILLIKPALLTKATKLPLSALPLSYPYPNTFITG